ncbi:carbonic anhydrase [Mycolicibacterium sp. 018/SC-01/001]|uniref:carbonic anhydrase n=1 Tax=Mycolicibacterium sp. 018/SC-01/001 TaxID=2592069 RepID=UPI00117D1655|nr:carbonic anhydrase [Mycolicibacterium sp. 018/SC-01/001]TRW78334.1 carbonic anhydrase [Mycolicibacterium sp. 018/SC-01/001]
MAQENRDATTTWQKLKAGVPMTEGGPVAAVFRCADAGISSEKVFGQEPGALLDVSTWGHTVDTSVLASLEYAVEALDVPLIVVLGHDDCPAMNAALRAWQQASLPDGAMRAAVEHALLSVVRRGAAADSVESVASAHIVETGLGLTQRSPALARKVDNGECGIVCATVNPGSGKIQVHAALGVEETNGVLVEMV